MILFQFILGSCIGSFVHASALRYIPSPVSSSPFSLCPNCHHRLSFMEMIPCISWFHLKGRCRWCHAEIPFHVVLCEFIGGLLTVFVFHRFSHLKIIGALLMLFSLLYCAYTDSFYGLIPDRTHFLLVSASFLFLDSQEFYSSFLFSLSVFILLFFIAVLTKGIGAGDVKLISCLALILKPYFLIVCVAIASCSSLLIYLPMLISGKINRHTQIPFGPFLSFGAALCLFFMN